jgi:DNA-directed RNA polymerase II subunit RPB1
MTENKLASKIVGIQFSILSPDEIRNGSVAEIKTKDTYINNKPVIGGLFDPRMGVSDPGLLCPTDGHDYIKTPGYFGHIELARPIFYIQYLNTIMKIIRCICIKCSKLLISKEKYKQLYELSLEKRWQFVFSISSKIKRCGEDNLNGCGCKQPTKVKKEGFANLIAEWNNLDDSGETNTTLSLTPEIILKLFRRISDEDVAIMGFSPTWSRPEWMICRVLAVPPPAVRPSVKHDEQQRSEDDLTHIIVNIIKANKTLQEKIQNNASGNIINDWTVLLQYYAATLVDNNISGVASFAQRSGRPLKSIKERLNGKGGRVRGNLMGKRVDYSARSVITPDPNISIRELGIPMKVAKNITKPVKVNNLNKKFLSKLVENGPNVYPGAKLLVRNTSETIYLENIDRNSIQLNNGDIVHRHMLDGDPILFNRQPTLHRMSMMCHLAKIMPIGDTFRMNVADTKPYNADFDGDEMNLHMPQSLESSSELLNLAAVPWQIISPANNKSIVGIFQDSLLGSYLFTRKNISFTPRMAMNMLMCYNKFDTTKFPSNKEITNFDILTQIMPPLSLTYKTKKYKDDENYKTSNNVLEIINGKYIRGQIEKGVFGDGSRGLLQRICNDFSNIESADFIDNIQNIITAYITYIGYSVGISDLIADNNTNNNISDVIQKQKEEVQKIIDKTHLGIFENKTGKSNREEFETQINNTLSKALSQAGKIGLNSLSEDNRFVIMVNAGSKGSEINISQMICCLGQQQVDGKRVPYGFTDRTLPHYNKYDDSPAARGFVENSFISGLTPQELFFHAMGGRVGLIDTAVKTSTTGYIQRRLIKGLEDIKIEYDMTVRNNKNKIIQFSYGDDGFDTVKVETQMLPLPYMSIDDIYKYVNVTLTAAITNKIYTPETIKRITSQKKNTIEMIKQSVSYFIDIREKLAIDVFKKVYNIKIHIPVSFDNIINNIQKQQNITSTSYVDITPLEAMEMIDNGFDELNKIYYVKPNELFKITYYYYLCVNNILTKKRFNKIALILLINEIILNYKKAIIAPGEMVGLIAAQSIGEPTTQMTLNTFHFAGVASKSNVTRGVPRIEEILTLSANTKNPSCTIYLYPEEEKEKDNALKLMNTLEHTKMRDIVSTIEICFDPDDNNTLIEEDKLLLKQYNEFKNILDECLIDTDKEKEKEHSKWILRIQLNIEEMLDKEITMDEINFAIKNAYMDDVACVYSDYNSDNLIFRIRLKHVIKKSNKQSELDQQDEIYILKNFHDELLDNLVLRGVKNINKLIPRKITDNINLIDDKYQKEEIWVLDSVGTNLLDLLSLDYIDTTRTYTNDIQEIYKTLGIEAARQSIFNELSEVIEFDNTYINYHHLTILCDRMTCSNKMISIFRHGINNDDIGPIAKASFEETPEMFLKAARHAELDNMRGVSANVMCGQKGYFGTNAFDVILDIDKVNEFNNQELNIINEDEIIENGFNNIIVDNMCSVNNLHIQNNIDNIVVNDLGEVDDYNNDEF